MMKCMLICVLLAAGGALRAQEEQEDKSAQQEEAIAAIQKMKGRVEVDAKRPACRSFRSMWRIAANWRI